MRKKLIITFVISSVLISSCSKSYYPTGCNEPLGKEFTLCKENCDSSLLNESNSMYPLFDSDYVKLTFVKCKTYRVGDIVISPLNKKDKEYCINNLGTKCENLIHSIVKIKDGIATTKCFTCLFNDKNKPLLSDLGGKVIKIEYQ